MNRRLFLGQSAALIGTTAGMNKLALASKKTKAHVVVVGAGLAVPQRQSTYACCQMKASPSR